MSNLPGNPHYDAREAVVFSAAGEPLEATELLLSDLAQATLALAFEQRTANLLHALEITLRADSTQLDVDPKVIAERLGIDPAPSEVGPF